MSLLPRDYYGDWTRPRLFDPGFDRAFDDPFFHRDLATIPSWAREGSLAMPSSMMRESALLEPPPEIRDDSEKFQVRMDVSHFRPEEINVRVIDKYLEIEARHEETKDRNDIGHEEHGTIKRHFVRKYLLPDGVETPAVESSLDANGLLTIKAPKKPALEYTKRGRMIPIQYGPKHGPIMLPVEHKK